MFRKRDIKVPNILKITLKRVAVLEIKKILQFKKSQ